MNVFVILIPGLRIDVEDLDLSFRLDSCMQTMLDLFN
jgi:hypothetical protein